MVKTVSTMVKLGSEAPHFSLLDVVTGHTVTLDKHEHYKAYVIMFICNHCPYVKHIIQGMIDLANDYIPKNIRFIAISANDADNYPDDSPDKMKHLAIESQYPFPYLFDETQEVAKAYQAVCTPDFFVYNNQLSLVYRGQFDDSRPGSSIEVTGNAVRHALDALLNDSLIPEPQLPSLGCNIKWKHA